MIVPVTNATRDPIRVAPRAFLTSAKKKLAIFFFEVLLPPFDSVLRLLRAFLNQIQSNLRISVVFAV